MKMKFSVKLQDQQNQGKNHHPPQPPPVLLRTKIPVTIFNLPFLSHFSTTTTHPSDISLSLSTNFPSFPSLKLSYAAASTAATPPLTFTLKSGSGLFGSPKNSPLVVSAHFSFNPCNPSHPNPTFSLLLKPRLGSFSVRKFTSSHPQEPSTICDLSTPMGFVPLETPPSHAKELSLKKDERDHSIPKGIHLAARTEMPVSKIAELTFRWRVNFTGDQMPVLRINKIGIQRVAVGSDDVKNDKKKGNQWNEVELEMLKGMSFWMKNELDALTRANNEMKRELGEIKAARWGPVSNVVGDFRKKAMPPCVESSSQPTPSTGFEQWRSKKSGKGERDERGKKEGKKIEVGLATDVENELQRAIKAAATAALP